jgi:ABC-type phosphate transport system substrate-binding protein
MNMTSRKRIRSGPLALLMGLSTLLSVICCGVFAESSAMAYTEPAWLPKSGLNCNAHDGKIDGRGSTYQEEAQQKTWSVAYTQTFCGASVEEAFTNDPAGHTMVAYNYLSARENSDTGSGNGLKAMSCRTDDFGGTDIPYSNQELANVLDGPVGAIGRSVCEGLSASAFKTPFEPLSPWPDTGADHEAPMMSFPIGGSSVAVPFNLTSETCSGTPPTSLNLTVKDLSNLFGGNIKTWNEAGTDLVEENPGLSTCSGKVIRVVRQDNSGTTNIFKSTFALPEAGEVNQRTGATCAAGHHWLEYFESNPNTFWPGTNKANENSGEVAEGKCSEVVHGPKSGNAEVLEKLKHTPGGIGYVDTAQAINQGLGLANVASATTESKPHPNERSYQLPNSGHSANCSYSSLTLPGATTASAVGLNLEDNWSNNNQKPVAEGGNEQPQHGIATHTGSKYPICGLTWDMVYTNDESSTNPNVAIARMNADQRRTLYSYFSFILSDAGQALLNEVYYASLPTLWLQTLREGFQAHF